MEEVNRLSEFLLGMTIIAMFLVLLAQIFTRFIIFIPLPSSQDLLIFFMLVSVFLGAAIAVPKEKHIAIEFLMMIIPDRFERSALILPNIVSVGFLSVVFYQALILMGKNKGVLVGASPVTLAIYYLVVAVGCFLMILNYAAYLIKNVRISINRERK